MAITVGTGTTTKKVVVVGSTTQVKQVVVGTPVRRVTSGAFSVDNLDGFNTTNKVNGSVLVYNSASGDFEATLNLELQIINGGQY